MTSYKYEFVCKGGWIIDGKFSNIETRRPTKVMCPMSIACLTPGYSAGV